MSYSLDRNVGSAARTGTLSVAGLTFTVIQAGAPPDLNGDGIISPNEYMKACPCFDVKKEF